MKRILALMFCTLLFCVSGCAKDRVTGKDAYNWYSVAADIKLGNDVLNSQSNALRKKKTKKGKPVLDAPQNKQELIKLRAIIARIKPVTHYPTFPYEVHIADIDVANAWCAPGGKMMVLAKPAEPIEHRVGTLRILGPVLGEAKAGVVHVPQHAAEGDLYRCHRPHALVERGIESRYLAQPVQVQGVGQVRRP